MIFFLQNIKLLSFEFLLNENHQNWFFKIHVSNYRGLNFFQVKIIRIEKFYKQIKDLKVELKCMLWNQDIMWILFPSGINKSKDYLSIQNTILLNLKLTSLKKIIFADT